MTSTDVPGAPFITNEFDAWLTELTTIHFKRPYCFPSFPSRLRRAQL